MRAHAHTDMCIAERTYVWRENLHDRFRIDAKSKERLITASENILLFPITCDRTGLETNVVILDHLYHNSREVMGYLPVLVYRI